MTEVIKSKWCRKKDHRLQNPSRVSVGLETGAVAESGGAQVRPEGGVVRGTPRIVPGRTDYMSKLIISLASQSCMAVRVND